MPDRHRDRNRSLGPLVPMPDVQIGPAYGGLADLDQDILGTGFRYWDVFQPQAGFGPRFHQSPHETTPRARPTSTKAATAVSISALVCPADICVRILVSAPGTTEKEKPI